MKNDAVRLSALAFLFLAVPLVLTLSGCKPRPTRPTTAQRQKYQSLDKLLTTKPDPRLVGKVGTLYGMPQKSGQISTVAFAVAWEDFNDFANASLAINHDKIREMVAAGKILGVPSGQVQAVFLESRATQGTEPVQAIQVKLLSGDYKDQTVWTYAPFFQVTQ